MNKEHFSKLLEMGYTPAEALDMLSEQAAEPKPEPEPLTLTAPETEPEPEPEPVQKDPSNDAFEYLKAQSDQMAKAILDLTKSIQNMNRLTASAPEPERKRADEFIAEIIKGGK